MSHFLLDAYARLQAARYPDITANPPFRGHAMTTPATARVLRVLTRQPHLRDELAIAYRDLREAYRERDTLWERNGGLLAEVHGLRKERDALKRELDNMVGEL